jgi:transposase-like protein
VYRAVDQHGQVIGVLVSQRRDADAVRRFFRRALSTLKVKPTEVVTDAAPVYLAVLDELIPSAWHHVEQYANSPIEADHSQLKHRLKPMRGLRTDTTAQVIIAGHADRVGARVQSADRLAAGQRRTGHRTCEELENPGDRLPGHARPVPTVPRRRDEAGDLPVLMTIYCVTL